MKDQALMIGCVVDIFPQTQRYQNAVPGRSCPEDAVTAIEVVVNLVLFAMFNRLQMAVV